MRRRSSRTVDSLEPSGRAIRHFTERSLRPDLSTGALRNEPDRPDDETDEISAMGLAFSNPYQQQLIIEHGLGVPEPS